MAVREVKKQPEQEELLLRFLQRTKNGDYAEIAILPETCIRVHESRDLSLEEDVYTFSYA